MSPRNQVKESVSRLYRATIDYAAGENDIQELLVQLESNYEHGLFPSKTKEVYQKNQT